MLLFKSTTIPTFLIIVCLIVFTPVNSKSLRTEKTIKDSIIYYQRMTLINYQILKQHHDDANKQIVEAQSLRPR